MIQIEIKPKKKVVFYTSSLTTKKKKRSYSLMLPYTAVPNQFQTMRYILYGRKRALVPANASGLGMNWYQYR